MGGGVLVVVHVAAVGGGLVVAVVATGWFSLGFGCSTLLVIAFADVNLMWDGLQSSSTEGGNSRFMQIPKKLPGEPLVARTAQKTKE